MMTPQDLKNLYEEQTGVAWSNDEGVQWLNRIYEQLDIYFKTPVLDKSAHIDLSGKATWLSQQGCHICHSDGAISVIPLRISPESWQALGSVNKAALAHRFSNSPHIKRREGRVCLKFLFVCSAARRIRDVDNMAKLLMDSVKDFVMQDDREVDHLDLMRLVHDGAEEYIFLRIAGSNINDHSDVVSARMNHSWAGGELLNLEDFKVG